MRGSPRALSDRDLALAIGAALFVLSAWPLLLVELPPFQDLPNHLASAYIVHHLERYPAYACATLLPLLFQHRRTSDFTASLTHAWGYYVLARQTSAPLVFAVERSYELTYRTFPPDALIPPALDRFAERNATPAERCGGGGDPADCRAMWRLVWAQFWAKAEPRFSHVLTWAMPAEARAMMPSSYRVSFAAGDLTIWERSGAAALSTVEPEPRRP